MGLPFCSDEDSLLIGAVCMVTVSLLDEGLAAPMFFLGRRWVGACRRGAPRAVLMTSLLFGSYVASRCLVERGLVGALCQRLGMAMVVFLSNEGSVA